MSDERYGPPSPKPITPDMLDKLKPIGLKYDAGKPRFDLVPPNAYLRMVHALTHGSVKYSDENWRAVPSGRKKYYRAALGHIHSWRMGEELDSESGLPHLAHAMCCIAFLLEKDELKEGFPDAESG